MATQTEAKEEYKIPEFHDRIEDNPEAKYPAEKGRYHIYHSSGCPLYVYSSMITYTNNSMNHIIPNMINISYIKQKSCHRVLTVMALKGLNEVISASDTEPEKGDRYAKDYVSFEFSDKYPDPLHKESKSIWDIYKIHDPNYPNKKLTVPVLFDKKTQKIVNNESIEIIEFFNSEFNKFAKNPDLNLNPLKSDDIQTKMKEWKATIMPNLNGGVYKCVFAPNQEKYEQAFDKVFETLDKMEECLKINRYLCGDKLTLVDIISFTTLVRFDLVYFTLFKCNLKLIQYDYPNIFEYAKEIYQMNDVKKTVDLDYIKLHYYKSFKKPNPLGIIPIGPKVSFDEPHKRDKIGK